MFSLFGIDTVPVEINGEKKQLSDVLSYHDEQARELHKKCRVHCRDRNQSFSWYNGKRIYTLHGQELYIFK